MKHLTLLRILPVVALAIGCHKAPTPVTPVPSNSSIQDAPSQQTNSGTASRPGCPEIKGNWRHVLTRGWGVSGIYQSYPATTVKKWNFKPDMTCKLTVGSSISTYSYALSTVTWPYAPYTVSLVDITLPPPPPGTYSTGHLRYQHKIVGDSLTLTPHNVADALSEIYVRE